MARLFEYQSKALLAENGLAIPRGFVCSTPQQAFEAAEKLGGKAVVKAQVFTTKRASFGGVALTDSPKQAMEAAERILGMTVKQFVIESVLVEERLDIEREFYAGFVVDDSAKAPVLIVSSRGGTGIEEVAAETPELVARETVDLTVGVSLSMVRQAFEKTGVSPGLSDLLAPAVKSIWETLKGFEARSAEVNPLVVTADGRVYAADARVTVDDHSVFRHPELGIEIAREFSRPPTELERSSWEVEKDDYRGTFYFFQLETDFKRGDGVVGFHGAGGGGSMMSMDAVLKQGFKLANFCDTSGNPPASKVYRAARIILAQGPVDGYFGSGSGVASQEQFHSARGLVKAFREVNLNVPAVLRLGGNKEEFAIKILTEYTKDLPAPVEGYGKDASPDFCAGRLAELIENHPKDTVPASPPEKPAEPEKPYRFNTITGEVVMDHALCERCESKACVSACVPGILTLENSVPVLNITREEAAKGKCTECLACDVDCAMFGLGGGRVILPIPGLDEEVD